MYVTKSHMVLSSLHFPHARVEYKSALIYDNVFIGLRIRYRWVMNTLSSGDEYVIVFSVK